MELQELQNSADLSSIWSLVIEIIHGKYLSSPVSSERSFHLWFDLMQLSSLDRNKAVCVCESATKRDIIAARYTGLIADSIEEIVGFRPAAVEIAVDPSLAPTIPGDISASDAQSVRAASPDQVVIPPMKLNIGSPDNDSQKAAESDDTPDFLKEQHETAASPVFAEAADKKADTFENFDDYERHEAEQNTEFTADGTEPEFVEFNNSPDETRGERRILGNEDYTFENFIVGNSNRFAHAAALNVADNVGMKINPLFIYGPSGLGKTHLMYAIANRAIKRNPGMKVIYLKGEEFLNQLIVAIQKNWNQAFRAKYRSCDMLLIDDIQFIAGKESTQTEFFHTFDALYEDHKQIILTSDRPPRELTALEERIRSRFEAGLLADIQPPDYELRLAILQNKISQNHIDVPTDVVDFLARNLQENIRQLEGVIKKLAVSTLLTGQPVNMDMVLQTVSGYMRDAEPVEDTVNRIIECVSKRYSVSVKDILGSSRVKKIKTARNAAMYIVRSMTNMSLPQMGTVFCRDHSTIHSNINAFENELSSDPILEATVNEIMKEIKRG